MDKKIIANTLIRNLGGTTKAARYFEIEPPSVSGWRRHGIPKARTVHLKAVYPKWFDQDGHPIPISQIMDRGA